MRYKVASTPRAARPTQRPRRGAIYAVVLLTATAVSIVGLSAVVASRHIARRLSDSHDFAAARRNALSGLDYAIFRIANDPNWRSTLQGASWTITMPIGDGDFETIITDPHDSDMLDDWSDPIRIESTGTQRNATHITRVELDFPPSVSPLRSALHAGGSITFSNAKLNASGTVSANGTVTATGSRIGAPIEAVGAVSGATYLTTPRTAVDPRTMPVAATVLAAYEPSATNIPITSIGAAAQPSLIGNGTFESGVSPWTGVNSATLDVKSNSPQQGAYSLEVADRTSINSGALCSIKDGLFASGSGNYRLRCWVRSETTTARQFRATISWKYTAYSTNTINVVGPTTGNSWALFDATFNGVNFSPPSDLSAASIQIYTATGTTNFSLDSVELRKVVSAGPREISGVLLTPTNNPWGAANAAGIYIIDCNNETLVIRNSRIVATLILKRPGPNTRIDDSVVWEAPTANQPALIVDGNLQIGLDAVNVREQTLGVNLNPPGTPYRYVGGSADDDTHDRYEAKLHGLVYVTGNLTLSDTTAMQGVVIVGGNATIDADVLNLAYDDAFAQSPPPGFGSPMLTPWIVGGSFVRVVR
ncbi:MAG: carbohydrate binding domain-containing protein [Phycisphaerae bacterium]|nr:carbohydrate binding domain-containing protein [Phycisphaerae bacterium]